MKIYRFMECAIECGTCFWSVWSFSPVTLIAIAPFLLIFIGPRLDKTEARTGWSYYSVIIVLLCMFVWLCVYSRATGHNFWPKDVIVWLRAPSDTRGNNSLFIVMCVPLWSSKSFSSLYWQQITPIDLPSIFITFRPSVKYKDQKTFFLWKIYIFDDFMTNYDDFYQCYWLCVGQSFWHTNLMFWKYNLGDYIKNVI